MKNIVGSLSRIRSGRFSLLFYLLGAAVLSPCGEGWALRNESERANRGEAPRARLEAVRVEGGTLWRDGASQLARRFAPDRTAGKSSPANGPSRVSRSDGTALIAADRILRSHAKVLGFTGIVSQLKVDHVREGLASAHVRYRREVHGYPVVPGGVGVHMDLAGEGIVTAITVDPRLEPRRATPVVGETAAEEAALDGAVPTAGGVECWLVYREEEGTLRLTWQVRFFTEHPLGDWEIWIDAISGVEISRRNRARNVDGTGTIWTPNPVNVLETENLTDRDDADHAEFDDAYISVTLSDLEPPVGGRYFLTGPWVTITDHESPNSGVPWVTDPDSFRTTREDDLFEAVMVYYHIDQSQRYLRSLGFTGDKGVVAFSIHADPHGLGGDDNSHYILFDKSLAFGDGGVDDAEDADVIVHEYGHAIQDDQVPGWYGGGEMGSMGEGFGDYWAEAYSQRIGVTYSLGQVFDWDRGPMDSFWDGRRVDTEKVYPDDIGGGMHLNGEIWSGSLWDIRRELGGESADSVIIESHFFVDIPSGFEEGALAVLAADEALTGGRNSNRIFSVFAARGILEGSGESPVLSDVATPSSIEAGEALLCSMTVVSSNPLLRADLVYQIDGAAADTLTLSGEGSRYTGSVEPPVGTGRITYYYRAEDATGLSSTSPADAPAGQYTATVGNDTLPSVTDVDLLGPNPSSGDVSFSIVLAEEGRVKLAVYTVSGRMVKVLMEGNHPRGETAVTWDGRNAEGRRVAQGIYIYRFTAGDFERRGRLVHLR